MSESDYDPLYVNVDGKDGAAGPIASVLESTAEALREVGDGKRYDFSLTVEERDP